MSRYINPYTDFGFKKLFGSELNKELLRGFLNALLEEAKQLPDDKMQAKLAIARNFKNAGLDIAFIAQNTGLTINEINNL